MRCITVSCSINPRAWQNLNHMRNNSHNFFINFSTTKATRILKCKLNSYSARVEFSSRSADFMSISFIVFCAFPLSAEKFRICRGIVLDVEKARKTN